MQSTSECWGKAATAIPRHSLSVPVTSRQTERDRQTHRQSDRRDAIGWMDGRGDGSGGMDGQNEVSPYCVLTPSIHCPKGLRMAVYGAVRTTKYSGPGGIILVYIVLRFFIHLHDLRESLGKSWEFPCRPLAHQILGNSGGSEPMIGQNRRLVTIEPVEFWVTTGWSSRLQENYRSF